MEMSAPLYGNSIYSDGYLYVIYGREGDSYDSVTIEVTKYDSEGNVIKNLELLGSQTSSMMNYPSYGTWIPFSYGNPGNCSVVMRDDVLVAYFSRVMFNAHQSSYMLVVDTNTMELKTDGIWKAFQYSFGTSHSFDQRVIVSSDNNIVTLDSGDANARGFYLEKTEFVDVNSAYVHNFLPFHFREGSDASHGYNNIYATMGNIIEVSDGYIYVGASEKTLSLEYGDANYNEPWNLFVQKYKSNFETESSIQDIHMLDEDTRITVGTKPEVNYGKLFLSVNTIDYGVRWLTDYDMDTTIDIIRAVKIDNDRVFVIYEKVPVLKSAGESATADTDNSEIYYIILDKDANVVGEPVKVYGVTMSKEINYLYRDGYVIWTTSTGSDKKLTINKLKIGDTIDVGDIPITKIEVSGYRNTLGVGGKTSASVTYYPDDTTGEKQVIWSSSNPEVATVNEIGEIEAISGGITVITATTASGISTSFEMYVSEVKLNKTSLLLKSNEEYKLELDKAFIRGVEVSSSDLKWSSSDESVVTVDSSGNIKVVGEGTATITVISSSSPYVSDTCEVTVSDYLKGDMNKNGKIEFADVMILLRTYLGITEITDEYLKIGDMNSNGKIEFADVMILLRSYLDIE